MRGRVPRLSAASSGNKAQTAPTNGEWRMGAHGNVESIGPLCVVRLAMPAFCSLLTPPSRWPAALPFGLLTALSLGLLSGCGGGGGGGGGDAASAPTVSSSGTGFPLGVSVASPLAVLGTTLSLNSQSDLVRAVAQGLATLNSSQINANRLFQDTRLLSALCYGPSVNYESHDDGAPGNTGTLNGGGVAMWRSQNADGQPCAVAQLNTQLGPVTEQMQQAMLLSAALRDVVTSSGTTRLPDPGTTLDLRSAFTDRVQALLSGVSIDTATVSAADDASLYTYRLVLRRGTGNSAESLEISTIHTPNDNAHRFAGVTRLTHGHLSTRYGYGCTDAVDGTSNLYRVSQVTTLGYNRYDDQISTRLRAAHYCGTATPSSSSHFDEIAASVESGELNPAVVLTSNIQSGVKGWRRDLIRFSSDWNLSSGTADHLHGWQILPQDGAGRLFAVHQSRTGASTATAIYHAFGADLAGSDGTLLGMYCNWNGPNPGGRVLVSAFQRQDLTLTGGAWRLESEALAYGPTHTCQASTSMRFVDGTGALVAGRGADSDELDRPTGLRTDVQSEIVERGYWPPLLF